MKPVHFVGTSRDDLRELPGGARESAGYQLFKLQQGKEPDDWPLSIVGAGVNEIRVREESGGYRVLYVAKLYTSSKKPLHRLIEVEEGTTPMTQSTVTKGSGNIFRDLGFSRTICGIAPQGQPVTSDPGDDQRPEMEADRGGNSVED
jgi:hypothetical protein